jgi:transcriptional regulator with XRE-family HTH domain
MRNYFSTNLKKLLKIKGANQQQLAIFVGVKQTSISNWINGISSPCLNDLLKIYQYIGIESLDNLILKNLETGEVKLDSRLDNNIASLDDLLAAKDEIIATKDELIVSKDKYIKLLEDKIEPPVSQSGNSSVAKKTG